MEPFSFLDDEHEFAEACVVEAQEMLEHLRSQHQTHISQLTNQILNLQSRNNPSLEMERHIQTLEQERNKLDVEYSRDIAKLNNELRTLKKDLKRLHHLRQWKSKNSLQN